MLLSLNLSTCCPTLNYLWFVEMKTGTCSDITVKISKGLLKMVHLSVIGCSLSWVGIKSFA